MALNGPVGVNLVLNLQVNAVVLSNVNCGLKVSSIRQSVVVTSSDSNWESLETFCTVSGIVDSFKTVGSVVVELKHSTSTNEVLKDIGTDETKLMVFWGECNLSPESLEFLCVMLEVTTNVMFLFMGEVQSFLECDFILLVDLSSGLEVSSDSTKVWSVSTGGCSDLILVLGGLELSTKFSIEVPFGLTFICNVVFDSLGSEFVVSKGPVGVCNVSVDTDFGFALL